jgi:hypothetical protein
MMMSITDPRTTRTVATIWLPLSGMAPSFQLAAASVGVTSPDKPLRVLVDASKDGARSDAPQLSALITNHLPHTMTTRTDQLHHAARSWNGQTRI